MEELLAQLIVYVGEDYKDEQYLMSLLKNARSEIRRYMGIQKPVLEDDYFMVDEYGDLILRIAKFHADKGGKEGVASFTENGIQINYEGAGTPKSYFRHLTPFTKVM